MKWHSNRAQQGLSRTMLGHRHARGFLRKGTSLYMHVATAELENHSLPAEDQNDRKLHVLSRQAAGRVTKQHLPVCRIHN